MPASTPFAAQPRHKAHLGVNHVKLAPPSQSLCGAAFSGRAHLSDADAREEAAELVSDLAALAGCGHDERVVVPVAAGASRQGGVVFEAARQNGVVDGPHDLRRHVAPIFSRHVPSLQTAPNVGQSAERFTLRFGAIAQ